MTIELTDAERMTILNQLFEEAQAQVVEFGCTCTPSWRLSRETFGAYDLPGWISDHADDCGVRDHL